MRLKGFMKSLIAFVLGVGLFISSTPVSIYAVSNPIVTIVQPPNADKSAIEAMCGDVNDSLWEVNLFTTRNGNGITTSTTPFLTYTDDGDSVNIELNMQEYLDMGQENKQQAMQIVLDEVTNSNISRSNRNKIYNEICALDETTSALVRQLSSDVKADFVGGYAWFKPFSSPISIALGFFTIILFVTLMITMLIDIAYINLPVIQLGLAKKDKQGEKPRIVSSEAFSAVMESDSKAGTSYVNANVVYLKRKWKQLVIVSLCILYLASGTIYDIIARLVDLFRGVIG